MSLQLAVILVTLLGPPVVVITFVACKALSRHFASGFQALLTLPWDVVRGWWVNVSAGFFLAGLFAVLRPLYLWAINGVMPGVVLWSIMAGVAGIVLSFYIMVGIARNQRRLR